MKFLINMFLVLVLFVVGGVYVNAQEEDGTSTEEMVDEESDGSSDIEVITEESEEGNQNEGDVVNEETEELTEEEIEEILEETEVLEDEVIEDIQDLEGEVVGVTDDEVIIKTEDGEVIVVSTETYENKRSGGSSSRRKAKVGETIETVSVIVVEKNNDNWKITTNKGVFTIPMNTPVTLNGNMVSVNDIEKLEETAEITVVTDENDNVVAIDIIGDLDKTSNTVLIGSIIAVIVVLLLAFIFRKKEEEPTV
jgi:hypothetical protein